MKPQFLVGAMMPGSGQTLVALGLMRALRQRNLRVQSFKCGPELQTFAIMRWLPTVNR